LPGRLKLALSLMSRRRDAFYQGPTDAYGCRHLMREDVREDPISLEDSQDLGILRGGGIVWATRGGKMKKRGGGGKEVNPEETKGTCPRDRTIYSF